MVKADDYADVCVDLSQIQIVATKISPAPKILKQISSGSATSNNLQFIPSSKYPMSMRMLHRTGTMTRIW